MFRPTHLGLSCVLFFCYPLAHAESATNKCTDGKTVTYANMPCEKLGLKSIGLVKNTITVVPAAQKSEETLTEDPDKDRDAKTDTTETKAAEAGKTNPARSLVEKLIQK